MNIDRLFSKTIEDLIISHRAWLKTQTINWKANQYYEKIQILIDRKCVNMEVNDNVFEIFLNRYECCYFLEQLFWLGEQQNTVLKFITGKGLLIMELFNEILRGNKP